LFAAIGTLYGIGDGSTTFNLPDLRGEFVRGFDDGRGVDTGRTMGSTQAQSYQSHNHPISSGAVLSGFNAGESGSLRSGSGGAGSSPAYQSTDLAGGTETRPRNIALLGCIKT